MAPRCFSAASSTESGQVDVAQHRAGDAARRRVGLDDATAASARPARPSGTGPPAGDREDRAVALGRVGERPVAVVVHDRVGERAERGDERPLQPGLDPDQVLRAGRSPAPCAPRGSASPRVSSMSWRRASSRSRRLSCRRRTSSSSSIFVDEAAPLGLELRSASRSAGRTGRRSVSISCSNPSRSASVSTIRSRTASSDSAEPLALAVARGERTLERLDLGAPCRRPPRRSGGGPPRSRRRSSSAARNASSASSSSRSRSVELVDDRGQLAPRCVRAPRRRCPGGRPAPPRRRAPHGRRSRGSTAARKRSLGPGAVELRRAERLLGVGERADRGGPRVGRGEHLAVEPVEPLARGLAHAPAPRPSRTCGGRARAAAPGVGRRRACATASRPRR